MMWRDFSWIGGGLCKRVDQSTDGVDGDANLVFALEGKGVGWNDAGAGEQKAAEREALIAEEIFDESKGIALELGEGDGAGELRLGRAQDVEVNLREGGH